MSLRVIANLVLAVVLGSVTAQAQETRLGQTSRATVILAQAWWTVAGQTEAQQQQQRAELLRRVDIRGAAVDISSLSQMGVGRRSSLHVRACQQVPTMSA